MARKEIVPRSAGDPRQQMIRRSDALARQSFGPARQLPGQTPAYVPPEDRFGKPLAELRSEWAQKQQERGKLSPDLAVRLESEPTPKDAAHLDAQIRAAKTVERGRARWAFNLGAPEHSDVRAKFADNGVFWEGFMPRSDDIGDGKRTIGIGFNMNDNASGPGRDFLESQGYNWNRLFNGQEALDRDDAEMLFNVEAADRAKRLAVMFDQPERARMNMHQWEGLLDLSYNWDPSGMKGTNMIRAMKEGDFNTAAVEIAMNTMGGIKRQHAAGVLARRYWQAAKVAGVPVNQLHVKVPGIRPYRETLEAKFPGLLATKSTNAQGQTPAEVKVGLNP